MVEVRPKKISERIESYDYLLYRIGDTYFAKNGLSGNVDYTGSTVASILTDVFNVIVKGIIFLKDIPFDLSKHGDIPENVRVVCNYGAEYWEYINSADSSGSPYTVSVGSGVNVGYYLAQDGEGRICYSDTDAATVIQYANDNLFSRTFYGGGTITVLAPVGTTITLTKTVNLGYHDTYGMNTLNPFIFDGGGASFTYTATTGTAFNIDTPSVKEELSVLKNCFFRTADANLTYERSALKINSPTGRWFAVENVGITGYKTGIEVDGCNSLQFKKILISTVVTGITIDKITGSSSNNAILIDGIYLSWGTTAIYCNNGSSFWVANCVIEQFDYGIVLGGVMKDVYFQNIHCENPDGFGDFVFNGTSGSHINVVGMKNIYCATTMQNMVYARYVDRLTIENSYLGTPRSVNPIFDVDSTVYGYLINVDVHEAIALGRVGTCTNFQWRGQGFTNSGTATILDTNTSVVAAHELAGTPTLVTIGIQHVELADVIWSADATNITFTVSGAVTADRTLTWYAEYKP